MRYLYPVNGCARVITVIKHEIMKKVVVFAAVVVVAIVAAWVIMSGPKTCNYEYVIVNRTDAQCKDTSACTAMYLSYPVFSKKMFSVAKVDSINASVYRQIVGNQDKTIEQMASEFFAEYKEYLAEREKIALEEGDTNSFVPTWSYSAENFVVVNAPRIIVTGLRYSQYTGGAHGMYGLFYANYDVETGRMLTLDDVFSDTLALAERMTVEFIGQKNLDAEVPFSEQGYFIDSNLLPLTSNFALLPDGVLFYYNVYEIAAYAAGPAYVQLPYEKLDGLMKFRPEFKDAEVFSADVES